MSLSLLLFPLSLFPLPSALFPSSFSLWVFFLSIPRCLSTFPPFFLSIYLYVDLSISLSTIFYMYYRSVYLSVCLSIYLSIYLSIIYWWFPYCSRLPDEWFSLDSAPSSKTVPLAQLPEAAKLRLQHQLQLRPQPSGRKQPRKQKFVPPPSAFLTPDEVKEQEKRLKEEEHEEQTRMEQRSVKETERRGHKRKPSNLLAAACEARGQLRKSHPASHLFTWRREENMKNNSYLLPRNFRSYRINWKYSSANIKQNKSKDILVKMKSYVGPDEEFVIFFFKNLDLSW